MKRILPCFYGWAFLALLLLGNTAKAQTNVFSDDFTTSAGTAFTAVAGPIGTSPVWSFSRSGSDFGARINGGNLTMTNDAGGTANNYGWGMAYTNTANFAAPYNTTLASNPGLVSWSFNFRQMRTNPGGFNTTNYGMALVLAGTTGTTNTAGTGYAVILGNSGSTDPVRLVRYSSGLRTYTTMISSNTTGLTDFGNQYLSVRVTYTPSTNTWQLFVRNDGTTAFQDPLTGSLTSQGTLVNNTYTSTALPMLGAYWNGGVSATQTSFFDNIKVAVTLPSLASLSPSSKVAGTGAFTLTVNGANFVSGTSVVRWNGSNRATTFVSATQLTAAITAADITSSGTASITVANGSGVSNALPFIIDPAGVPAITVSSSSLPAFNTVTGTASAASTYTVSGANLLADVGVTAPTNFEVSTNGTTFFNSLTLTRTGNVLVGQPVTVYVRLKASAPAGIYSGNIDHTTTGGTTKQVAVTGTVLSAQPTTQATTVTFTNVTSTSFTVNWANGNGSNRMVLVKSGSAVNSAPVDGISYVAQTAFGSGSEIGTGNYVVYGGTSNTVTVTGLSAASTYHVAVYEFNGTTGIENYLTTTPATGNRTTLNAPVGWQIYTANTVNTINFDTTVDGVNLDAFQADGLAPTNSSGSLNSNAWAIAGFSDGNIAFGGTSAEDGDYDSGVSEGGVTDGGVYAFDTPAGDRSLGIQPATGDFAPGTITLRFQNQTGAAVTSLSIGYKVYVYNDQAASSSFNFSHSADNATYTAVAGLNLTSPTTADVAPEWKAHYRVVTLTGLNIANNNYYYLRWSGATVSGSVDFDEFALDDIVAVANPTSVFAPFTGTAESFVVNGNTTLSGDTTVSGNLTFNAGKLDINGRTLALNGSVTNTVTGGIKGTATSNLTIAGAVSPSLSFDQTTPGTTNLLNNFTVATTASNTVTVANPVAVNGALVVNNGETLDFGTNALTGTLTAVSNNGTIRTQNTTALPIPSGKTWNGTGILHFNSAATAQTIPVGTYNNVTASATGGTTAGGALTVNGILNLPSNNPSATVGSLNMGSFALTLGNDGTNTGAGDVTGVVTRTSILPNILYTFGHATTSILFPNIGTLPTSMSLKIVIGTAPSWRTGAINRQYDFIQSGGANTKAVIKAHYLDSELNGNNEIKLVDWARIVSTNTVLEQGRSNFSTTENFVELTNVNVGLYFASVFDQVLLTLDESEASSLTWNGSVSTSWTTAANWTPNATPSDNTIVYIPDAATTPNDPILNPTVLLGSLNIEAGGILNAPNDSQFTLNNGAGAWLNNGTFNPGTGTSRVIFTNLDTTIAGTTQFNNVTINTGAGLRPITNNIMRVSGAFVRNGNLLTGAIDNTVEFNGTNQTIPVPNGALPGYNNLIINGTGAIFPASVGVTGNLTLNQPVDFTAKTVLINGFDTQTISGTSAPTFGDLTINKPTGELVLAANAGVDGTLTLTSGNLNISNRILTLGTNAVAGTFSATSMIVADGGGEVRRTYTGTGSYTFPIGDKTMVAEYSPISVNVTAGTFASAYVAVSVTDAKHPNNSSTDNYISRYWTVRPSGITAAVATVTSTYVAADIVGNEADIAAAQLNGTFSQSSNPWVRYAALSGNTLNAASAPLTNNQASYFTGIKGAAFSTMISGFGSFCQNQPVTLTANITAGDAPFTYTWSPGLGNASTANPPTATVGTQNYTLTVKDANGITATDMAAVTVLTPSVGGTVTPSQSVCFGTNANDLQLTGYTGQVVQWQSSSDLAFTAPTNIGNTTDILTGASIGPLLATTYFRAVVQNGSCTETYSTAGVIEVRSSTWNGTAWNNGVPDAATTVFITGNFTAASDLSACTLTVSNNAVVNIPSGFDVRLNGKIDVLSGSFTLENNANLIQTENVANSGNIVVKRNTNALMRLDYTAWSSPVANQNLLAFSPLTLTNRFYIYNTSTNLYNALLSPGATNFDTAKGYLIRIKNTQPTTPTIWTGIFTGVPNNGTVQMPLENIGAGQRFNLIGNPYPSPVDATAFVNANSSQITGTLYFWRKTNNELSPSYCSWTPLGGFVDNGEAETYDPNGILRTGQGFFVEALPTGTQVQFTNAQRSGDNADQFFRMVQTVEQHRIWLNATNATGAYSQTLVGYIERGDFGQ
ncbi:beta strand repeat-containing protein [Flavobacterium sp.]|uniref:beta strand repeat-containing protein n=1 Tax=Flavobacterium sp. TaxID=239 RepID=UPI0039E6ACC7